VSGSHARVDVLGVGVSAITMSQAVDQIAAWIGDRSQHYVTVTGVHGVMESQRDAELLEIHNASGLTTPDGMPLVWCCRRAGLGFVERVYGPDLMLAVLERGLDEGWRSYLYGGAPGVPDQLAARLRDRFAGIEVAGVHSPPFGELSPDDDAAIVEAINAARPDIVWVGLSTPKQERWMAAHVGRIEAPVLVGVGAAFDFHAGTARQAPPWLQRSGLEWAYRLAREPRRLWRRYLRNNPAFLAAIARRPPTVLAPASGAAPRS
jgi:N-acetylglucosaminyldiphosphoundecaprenol N-acetyl-beta-D-mannosaminyltransferase